jgi:ankyrin repeat protein
MYMGHIDKLKDKLFSNKKGQFLSDMYAILNPNYSHAVIDSDSIQAKIRGASADDLEDFFSAKNDAGEPLLHVALETGDTATITKYLRLLKLIPDDERRLPLLKDLLSARDKNGTSGLAVALKNGQFEAISAYGALLAELLPVQECAQQWTELLTAKNKDDIPGLLLAIDQGKTDAINRYQGLLRQIPEDMRNQTVNALLSLVDTANDCTLSSALENGKVEIVDKYKVALHLVPLDQRGKLLDGFLAARNERGESGLILAMKNGHAKAITAYKKLLEEIPPKQRAGRLVELLDDRCGTGIAPLSWAMGNGHGDAVIAFEELLEILSPAQRDEHLIQILSGKNFSGDSPLALAMKNGHADAIRKYKELLTLLSPAQRDKHLIGILAAKTSNGSPALAWSMQNGHADAILAYKELLELLSPTQRDGHLVGLLSGKDATGKPALAFALMRGHPDAIRAYKRLLGVLSPSRRTEVMVDLLAANQGRFFAIDQTMESDETGATITAYTELLDELLSREERAAHFADLLGTSGLNSSKAKLRLQFAMEHGHAGTIRAYKKLLELFPEASRDNHLLGILSAKDQDGNTMLSLAMGNGHAGAVTAYKELLKLLSEDQRRDHLINLFASKDSYGAPVLHVSLLYRHSEAFNAYENLVAELLELIPDSDKYKAFHQIFKGSIPTGPVSDKALFDHIGNTSHCSLLTFINNMDDKYRNYKILMMSGVATLLMRLKIVPDGSLRASLMDIWMENPDYSGDPVIRGFIAAKIVPNLITSANKGKLIASANTLPVLINAVQKAVEAEGESPAHPKGRFMLTNNGFFVQLMAACTNHTDPVIKAAAEALYDQYLNLPELAQHKALLDLNVVSFDGIRGTVGSDGEPSVPIDNVDAAYLFVHKKAGSATYDGLMLSKDDINAMQDKDKIFEWSNVQVLTEATAGSGVAVATAGTFNARAIFSQFALFGTTFEIHSQQGVLGEFLTLLNLKFTNVENEDGYAFDLDNNKAPTNSKSYLGDFTSALSARRSDTKLTNLAHLKTLKNIFGRFFIEPEPEPSLEDGQTWSPQKLPTLKPQHIREVLAVYGQAGDDADPATKARTLFCLAAVIARLTSSTYFGAEGTSPDPIRHYAAALLQEAHRLSPGVCGAENYKDYLDKLLGFTPGLLTCTDILSNAMMGHAKLQPDFRDILMKIKPIAWA